MRSEATSLGQPVWPTTSEGQFLPSLCLKLCFITLMGENLMLFCF